MVINTLHVYFSGCNRWLQFKKEIDVNYLVLSEVARRTIKLKEVKSNYISNIIELSNQIIKGQPFTQNLIGEVIKEDEEVYFKIFEYRINTSYNIVTNSNNSAYLKCTFSTIKEDQNQYICHFYFDGFGNIFHYYNNEENNSVKLNLSYSTDPDLAHKVLNYIGNNLLNSQIMNAGEEIN